ncbi:hypothetical protein CEXT_508681 [Caerostris extrusa]|uniref:Uncharacterized protein n=1 Tax=Caerostris extrusa TaxID=172846 RepID=A0AAV4TB90_CAEEX|nr:hypothetical protein CEXT_508681 [Caerostris extrusa]
MRRSSLQLEDKWNPRLPSDAHKSTCNNPKEVCCASFHINKLILVEFPPLSHSNDVGNAKKGSLFLRRNCLRNMCEAAYGNFYLPILDCKDSFSRIYSSPTHDSFLFICLVESSTAFRCP